MYRKIDLQLWADRKFLDLSDPQPCGKYLWIYLLTGPHTNCLPGLFRAGEAGLAESLGWPLKAFREAFREVFAKGLVKANWKAQVVYIPNAINYNPPQSPNVVRSWRGAWNLIPECDLKITAYIRFKAFLEAFGEAFGEAFAKEIRKPLANQEQEQEQEQEQYKHGESEGVNPQPLASAAPQRVCSTKAPEMEERRATLKPQYLELMDRFAELWGKGPRNLTELKRWYDAIRLMHTQDKLSLDEIRGLIEWTAQDVVPASRKGEWPGWFATLQSPAGLRRHREKIMSRMDQRIMFDSISAPVADGMEPPF